MEFDWDKIQEEANVLHLSEKVGAEIDARYAVNGVVKRSQRGAAKVGHLG